MKHENHDSATLAVLRHYGSPETRDEFLSLFYMGNVPDVIPAEEECDFPEKFQLATLIDTPSSPQCWRSLACSSSA
jgi:hypothetical protein